MPQAPTLPWKAALVAGDDQLPVFDNARKTLRGLFLRMGLSTDDIRELSISPAEGSRGVLLSSAENLQGALWDLSTGNSGVCLVHMTSHGSPQGFYVRGRPPITPFRMNGILDLGCGSRPTVVLISACYSGIFMNRVMLKPNRIILTASREDRTSFGCSPENEYTYWDGCLIENLPRAETWRGLYLSLQRCVEAKESLGRFTASLPQAYFGEDVAELPIPGLVDGSAGRSRCDVSPDATYGFSVANAIKVGLDASTGPARAIQYLTSLRGPNGQPVRFRRVGTSVAANGIVDNYELIYDGVQVPLRLYIDGYHFEEPRAPVGLICGIAIGLQSR